MTTLLQWGSGLFAFVAAVLWLKSAMIRTPLSFRVNIFRRGYSDLLKDKEPLSTPDIGHSPAMDELGEALQRQSWWSAWAAVAAAISAACQAVTMFWTL